MYWDDQFSHFPKKETVRPVEGDIIVYGTSWCGMTQMIRRYLDRTGITYTYLDLDEDPSAKNQLRWITGGYTSHPTVVIDGHALIEPSVSEVGKALQSSGYL